MPKIKKLLFQTPIESKWIVTKQKVKKKYNIFLKICLKRLSAMFKFNEANKMLKLALKFVILNIFS